MTRGESNTTMRADNQSIGSDWRGWGVRMGLVSMMATTGMVLAGHAAQAATTVEALKTDDAGQVQGDGRILPGLVPIDLLGLIPKEQLEEIISNATSRS